MFERHARSSEYLQAEGSILPDPNDENEALLRRYQALAEVEPSVTLWGGWPRVTDTTQDQAEAQRCNSAAPNGVPKHRMVLQNYAHRFPLQTSLHAQGCDS
ncbi:hypothetical protein FQR65_LT20527 [Abscondita terminalis]|nr:hypothetical protein FQR65_LT20527 [Abscondita terminalis]